MYAAGRQTFSLGLSCVIMAAAAVMALAITDVPFFTKGEPREALVVQQMTATGNLVLPLLERGEIQSKPPLFHWLGTGFSRILGGVTETTVRLPSLAASVVILAMTGLTGLRHAGPAAGLIATIMLATSFLWLQASTIARVDMVLAATTAGAVMAFDRAWTGPTPRLPTMFWLLAGLGVLAKGPVGLAVPAVVVACYLFARGEFSRLADRRTLNLPAALAGLALPLLWYLPAALEGGHAFLAKHLLAENLLRVVDAEGSGAGHVKPAWFYIPALLAGFAPWSVLTPAAAADDWRRGHRCREDGTLLWWTWIAVTVLMYSVAGSKRAVYLLSCYPALALTTGAWFARRFAGRPAFAPHPSLPRSVTLFPAALIALAGLMIGLEACSVPTLSALSPVLSRHDAANLTVVIETVRSRPALWLSGSVALAAAAGMLAFAGREGRPLTAFATVATFMLLTSAAVGYAVLPALAQRLSVRALLEPWHSRIAPDEPLSFYGRFDYLDYVRPAVTYYAGRAVPVRDGSEALGRSSRSWLLITHSRLDELRRAAAGELGASVRIASRLYDGSGSRREPLLLVELGEPADGPGNRAATAEMRRR